MVPSVPTGLCFFNIPTNPRCRNARVTFVIEWKEVETYQPALTPGSPPPPPVFINVDTSGFSAGAFVGGMNFS